MRVTSLNTARMILGSAPKSIAKTFKAPKEKPVIASATEKEVNDIHSVKTSIAVSASLDTTEEEKKELQAVLKEINEESVVEEAPAPAKKKRSSKKKKPEEKTEE